MEGASVPLALKRMWGLWLVRQKARSRGKRQGREGPLWWKASWMACGSQRMASSTVSSSRLQTRCRRACSRPWMAS